MKKRIRIAAAGCALALSIVGLAAAPAAAAPPWYQTNASSCVTEHGGKSGWFGYYMRFTNNCGQDIVSRLDCPWYAGGDKKTTVKAGDTKIWYGCGGFTPTDSYYGFQ